MKAGDRKSYNDWTRKVMARQTREHRHKKRIVRTLIFPTVLYLYETWTMTKKMEKRSTHVRCGYGARCKEYYGRRRRLMKVYAWQSGLETEGSWIRVNKFQFHKNNRFFRANFRRISIFRQFHNKFIFFRQLKKIRFQEFRFFTQFKKKFRVSRNSSIFYRQFHTKNRFFRAN